MCIRDSSTVDHLQVDLMVNQAKVKAGGDHLQVDLTMDRRQDSTVDRRQVDQAIMVGHLRADQAIMVDRRQVVQAGILMMASPMLQSLRVLQRTP